MQGLPANKRFEHEAPNLLWQTDFKGHFALTEPPRSSWGKSVIFSALQLLQVGIQKGTA